MAFATDMMKGPPGRWWDNASMLMTTKQIPKDKSHFKIVFLDK